MADVEDHSEEEEEEEEEEDVEEEDDENEDDASGDDDDDDDDEEDDEEDDEDDEDKKKESTEKKESTPPAKAQKLTPEELTALEAKLRIDYHDQSLVTELMADQAVDKSDRKAILQFVLKRLGMTYLVPEDEARVQSTKQEKLVMKDPSGHVTTRRQRHFNCDVCGTGGISDLAYNCQMCDWDCCLKCYKEHTQKVERELHTMREERQADSGRWRPLTSVGFNRVAEEGLLNELAEKGEDPVMVRLLCHAIWQLRLSHGAPLAGPEVTRALQMGNNYLDEEGVTAAVCGLLSTASKSLRGTECGKEIAQYAWACIKAFPASDTVAEGAIQLLFMFVWDADEERIQGIEQVCALRFGGMGTA